MPISIDIPPDRTRLSLQQAVTRIRETVRPIARTESVAVADAASRVLAEDVVSPVDLPPADVSAMDGIACRFVDLPGPLRVAGTVYAETAEGEPVDAGGCVRIMTGGAVPAGADTVVIREDVIEEDGLLTVRGSTPKGRHIRRRGENLARGETVFTAGRRLSAPDIGLLGSAGVRQVSVLDRPRIAIFATGSELIQPGERPRAGSIYESNSAVLAAMVRACGGEAVLHSPVGDDAAALEAALTDRLSDVDAVITSGGVSVGEKDLVPPTLARLGEVLIWKVLIKPGLPFLYGRLSDKPVFGLPGNPVSSAVTFLQLVRPAIVAMSGEVDAPPPLTIPAVIDFDFEKDHERLEFLRVGLRRGRAGWIAMPTGSGSSARLRSLSDAHGLLPVPAGHQRIEKGDVVEVELLRNA